MLSSIGAVMSIAAAGLAAGDDLLHVDARARVEHRAAVGDRDDRKCVGLALRHQARAVDRVDGDVDVRRIARADPLAVVEHRRLVLLPLADDDHAVHLHGVEEQPHGVDGGLVGGVLVAPAHPTRGRQRGGFGGTQPDRARRFESSVGINFSRRVLPPPPTDDEGRDPTRGPARLFCWE